MIQRDYLIIGSGIGGSSACESIRKYDKRGQITLVGNEIYPPYKRWMLSKTFLRDKVAPLKKLPALDAALVREAQDRDPVRRHGYSDQHRSAARGPRER